jgi:hypothetical protein
MHMMGFALIRSIQFHEFKGSVLPKNLQSMGHPRDQLHFTPLVVFKKSHAK